MNAGDAPLPLIELTLSFIKHSSDGCVWVIRGWGDHGLKALIEAEDVHRQLVAALVATATT